jgi:hypothetical protein
MEKPQSEAPAERESTRRLYLGVCALEDLQHNFNAVVNNIPLLAVAVNGKQPSSPAGDRPDGHAFDRLCDR